MTVYELVEKLGGEVVRGQARIRQGRDYVILGRLNGDNMEFTEEGRVLAAGFNAGPVTKQEEVPKRGRKAKEIAEPVVEDVTIDDDFTVSIDKE